MLAEDIVSRAATAAFARGTDGAITVWNRAAERLFALPADEAVGRRCCDVVAGRDVFGNVYCSESCPCWRTALRDRPIRPFRIATRDAYGHRLDLRVWALASTDTGGTRLVHLLERSIGRLVVLPTRFGAEDDDTPLGAIRQALTERELEVLGLLADGIGTDDIAARLAISSTTVRNHVSRCLTKLDVHSRLEAVSVGRRMGLV